MHCREKLILEQYFLTNDDNNYSVSDLLDISKALLSLSRNSPKHVGKYKSEEAKVLAKSAELTIEAIKNSDKDFLELFKVFKENGVLDKNDDLCSYFQHYTEERFRLLPKDMLIVDYAEFSKDIGFWYWNTKLI